MWIREAFKLEAKKIISYRVDFWMQFVVTALAEMIMAYYLWKNVFSPNSNETIGGYDFRKMIMYYLFVPFITRIVQSQNDWSTSREIYDGSLTRYLIYPISFTGYKFLQKSTFSLLSCVQMLLALAAIQIFVPLHLDLVHVFWGMIAALLGFVVYFYMNCMMELFAFWVDTVWSLGVMLRFIALFFGGAMVPLSLFPEKFQTVLKFTPFPYLFSQPIRIILGDVSYPDMLQSFGVCLVWLVPLMLLLNLQLTKGLKQYTGVGL